MKKSKRILTMALQTKKMMKKVMKVNKKEKDHLTLIQSRKNQRQIQIQNQ